jgi:acyl-CoA reductase-like NAD-dependent aldehyde dehydrogenase
VRRAPQLLCRAAPFAAAMEPRDESTPPAPAMEQRPVFGSTSRPRAPEHELRDRAKAAKLRARAARARMKAKRLEDRSQRLNQKAAKLEHRADSLDGIMRSAGGSPV